MTTERLNEIRQRNSETDKNCARTGAPHTQAELDRDFLLEEVDKVNRSDLETAFVELQEMFPGESLSIKRQEFYGTGVFHSSSAPFSVHVHVGEIGFSGTETVAEAMREVRIWKESNNGR